MTKLKDLLAVDGDESHMDDAPDTERDWQHDEEACQGCGSMPGDGPTPGCDDPMGCGRQDVDIRDAIADTQRDPSRHFMKHESAKFDTESYMEETLRLEESKRQKSKAPVNSESVGHVRQLRTQELPQNRIKIGR